METIRISVRSLVEFILRSGDIDNRRGAMADKEAMQMGSRLHRKIQGRMGLNYTAEVPLKTEIPCGDFLICVEGRADGIIKEESGIAIDEIKGVYRDLERMEEPVPVHLAQAMCYAYIYALQNGLENIGVQMTYANLDTEEIRRFRREYTFADLKLWFEDLISQYHKWAGFQMRWRKIRKESVRKSVFPYPYREGQRDLAAAVYRTIKREKRLFIQAPTGVGKTLSVIYPAIQAVGQDLGDKIFYLTAKTITRTVAQEAFSILMEQGLCYKVITLTAKEKICMCQEPDCNPEKCSYARGHFDRVNDAVFELLTREETGKIYTREVLADHAVKWQVCPFEMALDLSLWVDGVICDYNYVFDPQARLKRFFSDGVKGDYIFLIDEAHNLVERGREMFSASLYKEDFLEIKKLLKPLGRKTERALQKCNRFLLEWKRECEGYTILKEIDAFVMAVMNVSAMMEKMLEDRESFINQPAVNAWEEERRKKVLDFYFQVRAFLGIYETLDDGYEIYTELEDDGRFKIQLYCIQTAAKLGECLDRGRSAVFFSATLLPVRYYMELLAGTPEDYAVYAKSPFDPKKKAVLVGNDVTARYARRNAGEYEKISEYILRLLHIRRGNYLVFFPSYKMLGDVLECFERRMPRGVRVIAQNTRMTESEREEFLENFSEENEDSLVGFCVMGGIFGEGIDLKRERLIGAVIVGTGLPQICNQREILKGYYDKKGMEGFVYAYLYPGMNKVMQSAGRVIRTDQDTGVILLLDDRFCRNQYRSNFPREWADYQVCNLQNVESKLENFWKRVEKEK